MKLWKSKEATHDDIFGYVDNKYSWVPTFKVELLKNSWFPYNIL